MSLRLSLGRRKRSAPRRAAQPGGNTAVTALVAAAVLALTAASMVAIHRGNAGFITLLNALKRPADAEIVAERLLDALAEPYDLDRRVRSTVSSGVFGGDAGHATAADLIRDAGTAMYEAKSAGRGGYAAFESAMRARVERRELTPVEASPWPRLAA
ncbi:MAG: diguanylate cyclase [Planctomycetota bacterium]